MKMLKTREDAIKEAEYWKKSYADTFKELLDIKSENTDLKNDLEDVLNILIRMYQRLQNNSYKPKHERKG